MTLNELQIAAVRALEDANGRLTPDQVIAAAKPKDSALHPLFEWDKTKAAQAAWLQTAREVIGAVRIVVTTQSSTVKAPCYVRDPDATGQGYRSAAQLREDPIAARASLVYTLEICAGHLRRAYDLATPLGMTAEVDVLITQVTGLQRAIREAAA